MIIGLWHKRKESCEIVAIGDDFSEVQEYTLLECPKGCQAKVFDLSEMNVATGKQIFDWLTMNGETDKDAKTAVLQIIEAIAKEL